MKTILFLFGTLIVYTLPTFALNLPVNPPAGMEGIYEYKSAEAPYEYQKGTIELKKVENKWTAKVTANYQTFTAQEVKVEKTQVQFRISVDGNSVLIKLLHKGDSVIKLSGSNTTDVADFYEMINAIDYSKSDPAGLAVTTLFNGSRSNPFGRGSISNISITNFTARDLILGFMRGICNEIYDFYSKMPCELKNDKHIIIGSGNAIKKNNLLCRVLEDTFNFRVVKSEHDEDAAFGACITAVAGGNYIPGFDTIP